MSKTLKLSSIIIITALSLSVLIYTFDSIYSTKRTTNDLLWKQSVQQQLKERTEEYQNEIYNRYSRLERDLNNYQYNTNKRLDHLEDRLRDNGITINNLNSQEVSK